MHSSWVRATAAIGAAALALLLSGCRLQGTIEMVAPEEVRVDLTFDAASEGCNFGGGDTFFGLETEVTELADGTVSCRLTGTASADRLSEVYPYVVVTDVGEYHLLGTRFEYEVDDIDLLVTMPGEVVSTSIGEVSGNQVRITSDRVVMKPLKIVARAQPGSQWWPILQAGGALALGALLFGLGWHLAKRPPKVVGEPMHETFDLTPEAVPIADPAWYAPPPETRFVARRASDEFRAPPAVADNSMWAPPPPDGPESPEPVAPGDTDRLDPSVPA